MTLGVLEGEGVTVAVAVGIAVGGENAVATSVGVLEETDVADGRMEALDTADAARVTVTTPLFPGTSDRETVQLIKATIVKSRLVINQ